MCDEQDVEVEGRGDEWTDEQARQTTEKAPRPTAKQLERRRLKYHIYLMSDPTPPCLASASCYVRLAFKLALPLDPVVLRPTHSSNDSTNIDMCWLMHVMDTVACQQQPKRFEGVRSSDRRQLSPTQASVLALPRFDARTTFENSTSDFSFALLSKRL